MQNLPKLFLESSGPAPTIDFVTTEIGARQLLKRLWVSSSKQNKILVLLRS